MKFIGLREAKASLSEAVNQCQTERTVITRHGKPVAVLVGCEGYTMDDLYFAADPEFWKMIEERRAKSTKRNRATLEQARKHLNKRWKAAKTKATKAK